MAKVSRGSIRKIEVACVAWIDLLGYGSMLTEAYFNPLNPIAEKAINRLRSFHNLVASKAKRNFNILALNDGAAVFRDLSPRSNDVTFDFLRSSVDLHNCINSSEHSNNFPGSRMVIATGFRVRGDNDIIYPDEKNILLKKLHNGEITPQQGIFEASRARPHFGIIPELQANFAFTKAYLVDLGGTKIGFPGPNCYVDLTLFDKSIIPWITFDKVIQWKGMNMEAKFGLLKEFNVELAHKTKRHGLCNALEIANALSGSDDTAEVLLKLRVTKNLRMRKTSANRDLPKII
jgi:hypothetical protein